MERFGVVVGSLGEVVGYGMFVNVQAIVFGTVGWGFKSLQA